MNQTLGGLPVVALSKAAARAALLKIDDLQPLPLPELDYQGCVLIALRGRLCDRRREVPADVWPEFEQFLREARGLIVPISTRRRLGGRVGNANVGAGPHARISHAREDVPPLRPGHAALAAAQPA